MKKALIRLFALVLCLITAAPVAMALPENYVVRNGDREVPKIAITVDDGWNLGPPPDPRAQR